MKFSRFRCSLYRNADDRYGARSKMKDAPVHDASLCPCGSGAIFSLCCGPYLRRQAQPPTAEALMRSRYTAFVCRDADYLLSTWDGALRPARLDFQNDRTEWLGLTIVETAAGGPQDAHGQVEFIARFRIGKDREQTLHERSRFRRHNGCWMYVDGTVSPSVETTAAQAVPQPAAPRNAPCPCGSGQKFKRCCGR